MRKINLAIVGATGMVGRKMLEILEEYEIPIDRLYLYASNRSAGQVIDFRGSPLIVHTLDDFSFDVDIDYALFSAGATIAERYAPLAVKKGVTVIDNSSAFRMDETVPLIVPEVNKHHLKNHRGIIANPNCSTIQAVCALAPLNNAYGLTHLNYVTYQAVSGSGVAGLADLKHGQSLAAPRTYPKPIHNNILPQIDRFTEDGYTKEELKMIDETRKILNDNALAVTATCVRVPVENGHSVHISAELKTNPSLDEIATTLTCAPNIRLITPPDIPTPLDVEGHDHVLVGRLRSDKTRKNGVHLFTVADNIRKGAASNAVQILKLLMEASQ